MRYLQHSVAGAELCRTYLQSRHVESLLMQSLTHLFLQSVLPPQNFMSTSPEGLISLSVITMLLLADDTSFRHADEPQECTRIVTTAIAVGCKWNMMRAILDS